MPELPEVETTKRGVVDHISQQRITQVNIDQPQLRWPITPNLAQILSGASLITIKRRAKYLLFVFEHGTLIIHLGMSGSLRLTDAKSPRKKHDHVEIIFENGVVLRYHDPRRFGAILWTENNPLEHALLKHLGPEPLSADFNDNYLLSKAHNRRVDIKQLIMNAKVVVGVGNIYATESLFIAGIKPTRAAHTIKKSEALKLVDALKKVLANAIESGGTTLRDFVNGDGKPGYFKQELLVYGRKDLPCIICKTPLNNTRINNRATVYCTQCQR